MKTCTILITIALFAAFAMCMAQDQPPGSDSTDPRPQRRVPPRMLDRAKENLKAIGFTEQEIEEETADIDGRMLHVMMTLPPVLADAKKELSDFKARFPAHSGERRARK